MNNRIGVLASRGKPNPGPGRCGPEARRHAALRGGSSCTWRASFTDLRHVREEFCELPGLGAKMPRDQWRRENRGFSRLGEQSCSTRRTTTGEPASRPASRQATTGSTRRPHAETANGSGRSTGCSASCRRPGRSGPGEHAAGSRVGNRRRRAFANGRAAVVRRGRSRTRAGGRDASPGWRAIPRPR